MSFEAESGYNWREANPSQDVALPHVFEFIYRQDGDCNWLTRCNSGNEMLLDMEQDNLSQAYPRLFKQLDKMTVNVILSNSEELLYVEEREKQYWRGVTLALLSIESSLAPDRHISDISEEYLDLMSSMDDIDMESWLNYYAGQSSRHTTALKSMIINAYQEHESQNDLRCILSGAWHSYAIASHYNACVEREKEIAWAYQNEDSYEGWLAYKQDDHNY